MNASERKRTAANVLLLLSLAVGLIALVCSLYSLAQPPAKDVHFQGTITVHSETAPGNCVVVDGHGVTIKVVTPEGGIGARRLSYDDLLGDELYGKSSGQQNE